MGRWGNTDECGYCDEDGWVDGVDGGRRNELGNGTRKRWIDDTCDVI